jgi:hypothetical protein
METSTVNLLSHRLETLLEDGEFVLCRSGQPIDTAVPAPSALVVMPRSEHPRSRVVRMLEHEYSLRDPLDSVWAVRSVALTTHEGRAALVLEDPGGELLVQRAGTPMDLGDVLRTGAGVAGGLRHLHARGLIHQDLKPANVMIDWSIGHVWLRGFGIASRVPRERRPPEPPEVIAGTLAYMAPEQTGWMNRSIDARSDLYALGVVLYELSTGSLPFTASDAMGWVHCHIAQRPVPPAERRQSLPEVVSAIVMKLLAKTAEDRYQTAAGVEHDLRRCLGQWEAAGRIDAFPLAERDTPDRLVIPEKLYGRARDRNAARRFRARGDEWDDGAGARFGVLRDREIIGGQRAAQGARAAARIVCGGEVRSIQARHPLRHARPGLSEPRPGPARQERRRAEWLARRAGRGAGPEWAAHNRSCPGAHADHRGPGTGS